MDGVGREVVKWYLSVISYSLWSTACFINAFKGLGLMNREGATITLWSTLRRLE